MAKMKHNCFDILRNDIEHLSKKELEILYKHPEVCYAYAKKLDFENVPIIIFDVIARDWAWSFNYIIQVIHHKKSLINCDKLFKKVAENSFIATKDILYALNFRNIPDSLINNLKKQFLNDVNIKKCVLEHNRKKKLEKLLT